MVVYDGIETIPTKFEPSPRYFYAFLDAHFWAPNEVCFYMSIDQGILRLHPKAHTNRSYFYLIEFLVKVCKIADKKAEKMVACCSRLILCTNTSKMFRIARGSHQYGCFQNAAKLSWMGTCLNICPRKIAIIHEQSQLLCF